ncbi:hypothetical protein TNCV_3299221 [Trichonephila clavipes]|uniref:Uncharacterized protein n=1 Tax=Trichonephila clavipes TaxID=2585209 RepID=A0A8X7B8I9_TRICX|nr:hypothetical protein TNCV_3299221 [Trichonephila clavipes]
MRPSSPENNEFDGHEKLNSKEKRRCLAAFCSRVFILEALALWLSSPNASYRVKGGIEFVTMLWCGEYAIRCCPCHLTEALVWFLGVTLSGRGSLVVKVSDRGWLVTSSSPI